MAYTLQAVIGKQGVLVGALHAGLHVVRLGCEMEMVPLGETAQKTYEFPFCPLIDGGSTELPPSLLSLCLQLSDRGPVVYVEAEFFGGVGTQAYALFSPGESGAVLVSDTAINQALSWLGVSANGAFDEFEAVGLDQHRDTEEWVA